MLYSYLQAAQQLMSDLKEQLIPPALLITYINRARSQLASEGECIRVTATQTLTNNVQSYPFSGFTISASGVASALAVRLASITPNGSSVATILESRSYEWLYSYYIAGGTAETTGVPKRWAQQGQGSAGTIFLDPIPNAAHVLSMDVAALPSALVLDTDPEALPYPWQDAVPFFAAFYGFMYAQQQDLADRMFARAEMFIGRARKQSTPTVLPRNQPGFDGAEMASRAVPLTMLPNRTNRSAA